MAVLKASLLILVASVAVGAVAAMATAQCCRCDFNGFPESCNPGVPTQAECESTCASLSQTFGEFQSCPAGMDFNGCSDQGTFCDAICVPGPPPVATAPTTSTTGTLIVVAVLIGLGGYTLRRRRTTR